MSLAGSTPEPSEGSDVWFARFEGIVRLLEDVRWSAVSSGKETLEHSLIRYCRRQSLLPHATSRQPNEVAQEIRTVLLHDDSHPAFHEVSRLIPNRALHDADARSILTSCAEYLELGTWRNFRESAHLPPNSIEIRGWFPELIKFSETLLEESDGESVEVIVTDYLDGCHPNCLWILPELVGEAHRALATFPSEPLMQNAFDQEVPMASVVGMTWTEWFSYLAGAFSHHMSEAHANAPGETSC
ncbi:hypothetical protein ACQ86D_24595 [Streptomyces galilaeus]